MSIVAIGVRPFPEAERQLEQIRSNAANGVVAAGGLAGLLWDAAAVVPGPAVMVCSRYASLALAYVQRCIRFELDVPRYGEERFQSVAETLRLGVGDCDDKAPLLAALLYWGDANGAVCAFRARVDGWVNTELGRLAHVDVTALVGGRRRVFEATALRALPGEGYGGRPLVREETGAVKT